MSTNNSQALVEVQRALPVPQTRFDEFVLKAHELAEKAATEKADAETFLVDSEAAFQLADSLQAGLKARVKDIGTERLSLTRAIDDFKKVITDAEKSVIDPYNQAVQAYQVKMFAFRAEVQRKAAEARREAERLLEEQKNKQLEQARKLEERAAAVKTESAKQRLQQEAESIRQAATLMPESVTVAAAEPTTVASDLRDNWKGEVKQGRMRDALLWLAEHPEWWDVIDLKAAPMKRMAKQFHNVPEKAEPFRFWNDQGFATKRR